MNCPPTTFCPPILSDGRAFTNYTRNQVMNQRIRCANNLRTNNQFRGFLQKHTDKFMLNTHYKNMCKTRCHKFDACKKFGVCHRFHDYYNPVSVSGCL